MIDDEVRMTYDLHWPEWGAPVPAGARRVEWRDPSCGGWHVGPCIDDVVAPRRGAGQAGTRYTVIQCSPCCMLHVVPLPSDAALRRYYRAQFYEQDHPEYFARYEEDALWWHTCVHAPLLQAALAALGNGRTPRPAAGVRLLDVGAGPGLLLRTARGLGLTTCALDPSAASRARLAAAGHMVWDVSLEAHRRAGHTYDLVTLYETLEHLRAPEAALLDCYDLLAPGGVLAIVVPNDYNPYQLQATGTLRVPRWWLAPPQHLYYFTPKTLQLLLRRCGFTLVDLRSSYPMEQFLLEGCNYIGNAALGRACHRRRMADELAQARDGRLMALHAQYRVNLATQGIGRELIALAHRP